MSPRFADRLQGVQEYYFSQKLMQIQKLKSLGHDVINLGIGSPDLSPPEAAIQTLAEEVKNPHVHGYSSYRGSPELRRALSVWLKEIYLVSTDPDKNILPLLGSKEGIMYLSMALLNPGDQVLIPNPGYPAYQAVAKLLGAEILTYDLHEGKAWLPDLEVIKKKITSKTKLMWVNYPHMPTGARGSEKLFKDLAEFAEKNKIFVCNDNPYSLVLNNSRPLSLLSEEALESSWCGELNSLSKAFNMAGWRVGLFISHPQVIDAVIKVKSQVDSGMFAPVQKAAIEALKVESSWHKERNAEYRKRQAKVLEIFAALKFEVKLPQEGLFLWGKAPASLESVEKFCDDLLDTLHVFMTPGFIFGTQGERYGRLSLCAPVETMDRALQRIKKANT